MSVGSVPSSSTPLDFVLQSVESLDVDQEKGDCTMSFYQGFEHPWILDSQGSRKQSPGNTQGQTVLIDIAHINKSFLDSSIIFKSYSEVQRPEFENCYLRTAGYGRK